MNYPAMFALIKSHNADKVGIRVELRGNGRAWLVLQTDTDAGALIEARGCPDRAEAERYFSLLLRELA